MARRQEAGLLLPLPPGWVELKAFQEDAEALGWFDTLLAQTPGLTPESSAELRGHFARARAAVVDQPVDAAGVVITTLADATRGDLADEELTMWAFTVSQVVLPGPSELNPMAVIERHLATGAELSPDDLTETFRTPDGRDGIAVHTTLERQHVDVAVLEPLGGGGDAGGLVLAAVALGPVSERSNRVLLTTGVCPRSQERPWMALMQAHLTVGARVWSGDDPLPPGPLVYDATGGDVR